MQPNDARKGFPCFDEPSMKAHFRITVVHHHDFFALSNMPILEITNLYDYIANFFLKQLNAFLFLFLRPNSNNLVETSFEVSVQMSSYHVSLVISDFKCKYASAKAGIASSVNVSICGRPEIYDQLDSYLHVSVEQLEIQEKFFGVEYPLTKCGKFFHQFSLCVNYFYFIFVFFKIVLFCQKLRNLV